ncbi:CBS domain-containing protein [Acetohalobium arabaticum]|uniref:CBS domain containing membrane protein n=1 Tax=Acetohalobium arabaticum (strain ATCC 49924 / DSM 5501 / Z-7288) TaxID=574087 RepID=D9QT90_ACEAZ|nr:CBS domain-containing protein [Acetohalobium arabaticum]ADL13590.1 CBS domain containing membrane protein [Acetohalobium arabaticum DSM 5501]
MLAEDIMTEDVITVNQDDTIKDVARLLSDNEISGLPVINDDGEVVGIITEQDLIIRDKKLHFPDYIYLLDSIIYLESLREFEEEFKKMIGTQVEEVMTEEVITVNQETPTDEIVELMLEHKINRVPVIDNGELVGIISRGDLVKLLAD